MINNILKLLKERSFIVYAAIGLTGVVIDFVIYFILVTTGIHPIIASIISVTAGIVNNFFLNAHFNFKRKDHLVWRFCIFYAVGATGLVLSALLLLLFNDVFGIDPIISKLITILPIVIYQYWFNKNASFAINHKQIPWRSLALFAVCISVIGLFAFNGPYYNFTDENDNLLGAQMIANGEGLIYKDYFSHHMPLTYYIGVPLFVLFGTSLIAIKVAFGIVMAIWLLLMSRHILRAYGLLAFSLFTLLIASSQTLTWSNMILAETLIAFSLAHALILFITRDAADRSRYKEGVTYAIIGSIPLLSSLSFAPISVFIYILYFLTIVLDKKGVSIKPLLFMVMVSLIPYALFVGYLASSHTVTEFKEQAISFNTLYYSQFLSDAATSPTDGVLSIVQNSFGSLRASLTFDKLSMPQPLSFLFSVSIILCMFLIAHYRDWLFFTAMSVSLFLAGARGGFALAFAGSVSDRARAGVVVCFVGLLLVVVVGAKTRRGEYRYPSSLVKTTQICIIVFTLTLAITSLESLAQTGRAYIRGRSLVELQTEPGSPSTIINLINKKQDYYWIGPIDFSSQIITESKPASAFRFYTPWIASCPACKNSFIADIKNNRPRVVAFDKNMKIWQMGVAKYSTELIRYLEENYYQLDDIRLKQFYFDSEHKEEINAILSNAGYEVNQ